MKKLIKQVFCAHLWVSRLILTHGKNTHRDVDQCVKCGKSVTTFKGNRDEWYRHHKFDHMTGTAKG